MNWITCDEYPINEDGSICDHQFYACRCKDFFGYWRYTEAKWDGSWHIWNAEHAMWNDYLIIAWSKDIQWLKEK